MPELPEVETVRRGLLPYVEGQKIASLTLTRATLRGPIPPELPRLVAGKTIETIDRHGKTLLWRIDGVPPLAWHLGMSGSFRVNSAARPHDHVILQLKNGAEIRFNDPRRFGMLDFAKEKAGIDPMTPDFTAARLAELLASRATPIKSALLDQKLISGIGNIYACEALFLSAIHPKRAAGAIDKQAVKKLHGAIQKVLESAIASGGSSLRDHVMVNGEAGKFQHHFAVYDKAGHPCPTCAAPVKRIRQAGRSTFFCPQCQGAKTFGKNA